MPSRPRDVLGRLPLLLAILGLALNDHVLKAAWPGLLTGKLSDVTGLFAFPLVVWAGVDLLSKKRAGLPLLGVLSVLTAVLFLLLKTSPAARALYEGVYAAVAWPTVVTPDVTDLVCLPMPFLAWRYGAWHLARPGVALLPAVARATRVATLVCFGALTVASMPPMRVASTRPRIEAREGTRVHVVTDARLYTDRPFEVTLPGGSYRRVTLIARDRGQAQVDPAADVQVLVVDEVVAGDPRLDASPVRLFYRLRPDLLGHELEPEERPRRLEPIAAAPASLQLQVEDDQGHVSRFDLSFEEEPVR